MAFGVVVIGLCLIIISSSLQPLASADGTSLYLVTVATRQTDGLQRLKRSTEAYGIPLNIFGLDEQKISGHAKQLDSDTEKIRLLLNGLEPYKNRQDLVVLYVDADYTIVNGAEGAILEKFHESFPNDRVVFSASNFCSPEAKCEQRYPNVRNGKRYLNANAFIGYASELWKLLESLRLEGHENAQSQSLYGEVFVDETTRNNLRISLDSTSQLMHNLDASSQDEEIRLEFSDSGDAYITNVLHNTNPLIIHGDQSTKCLLNYLGNYIGKAWSADFGCSSCSAANRSPFLKDNEEEQWPMVTLALMLSKPIPFVSEFLDRIENMEYPKRKIDLYFYNNQPYNEAEVNEFVTKSKQKYHSVEWDNNDAELGEREARRSAIDAAIKAKNEFVFLVDADVHFVNTNVLRLMIESAMTMNLGILSPLIGIPNKFFTNFWGDISSSGYYQRSEDYTEIVTYKRVGVWNVPYIASAVLIAKNKMPEVRDAFAYDTSVDADMSFCEFARNMGHFLFVDNQHYYGFLANTETFDSSGERVHPEMYQIFENRVLWESRYIDPGYFVALDANTVVDQPCPDVYDFPLMSERFAKELIDEMENYGQWSDGSHKDERLAGGYENVPTVDIHMKQIDFERPWLHFLDEYVRPMQEKLFIGYYQQPIQAIMMFVVRYKPGEQASLRAHHDASTYTIDVPLNKRGVDFEGGGVRYIRYNCTVDADQIGHAAMFPGRLTHLHEGLTVTKGIRYIAVSFLNP